MSASETPHGGRAGEDRRIDLSRAAGATSIARSRPTANADIRVVLADDSVLLREGIASLPRAPRRAPEAGTTPRRADLAPIPRRPGIRRACLRLLPRRHDPPAPRPSRRGHDQPDRCCLVTCPCSRGANLRVNQTGMDYAAAWGVVRGRRTQHNPQTARIDPHACSYTTLRDATMHGRTRAARQASDRAA